MHDSLRSAPCTEQALVDVTGLARRGVLRTTDQKVIKAANVKVSAGSRPDDRPVVPLPFEADAHGVTPAGNRNLIGNLPLVGHAVRAVINTAENRKAARGDGKRRGQVDTRDVGSDPQGGIGNTGRGL